MTAFIISRNHLQGLQLLSFSSAPFCTEEDDIKIKDIKIKPNLCLMLFFFDLFEKKVYLMRCLSRVEVDKSPLFSSALLRRYGITFSTGPNAMYLLT